MGRKSKRATLLETTLASFNVSGKVTGTKVGPVVTLFEFEPDPGIKASKVLGLADDVARAMSAVSCRASVIPGRKVIGIEIPNEKRKLVPFDDITSSDDFNSDKVKLAFAMGVDIGGTPVVSDITRMPHLLMAGTTGSGKSVAMNTLIYSLLKRMTPEECKFVMIDPKQLELSVYAGIPHLLMPVVTDPHKAVEALRWTVSEMEDRYSKMSSAGVRNIGGYNESNPSNKLPFIVVVIDEVADLMMVAGKEIEALVQRLAQMARAAGIHIVMATQRPSVDVITGTIKANFPTRIAFQVTSKYDSNTILGEKGAEQLLGMGDMLLMMGGGKPRRVHGAFVSDEEVESFTNELRASGKPNYVDFEESPEGPQGQPDAYQMAVRECLSENDASIGFIQRTLWIPYFEAAEIVSRMEKEGLVSKPNNQGVRTVLIPN